MSLQQRLKEDLKKALREEDRIARSSLRFCLSAINNAEIVQQKTLDGEGVLTVLSREIKQREESIEAFLKGRRQDLADQEQAELNIIVGYLSQPRPFPSPVPPEPV